MGLQRSGRVLCLPALAGEFTEFADRLDLLGNAAPVPWSSARITGHIRIAAPIHRVFDTVADSRNEPSFDLAMTGVELLAPPPIGLGTRFRARMGKAGMQMLIELTEFDRPHRLGSRTISSMIQTSGTLTFAAEDRARS